MTLKMGSPKHFIILLHYRNITCIIKEWSYGDFYPEIYYYYDIPFQPMRFKLVKQTERFGHYERIL